MAKKRRGRPISGWLILDKPAGMGSTDAVSLVKRKLGAAKAGHAGTLDPAAMGLLVIALGEATKCIPYVTDALKAYRFTVTWGAATSTDDSEGEVIETRAERPDEADIRAALSPFLGQIQQIPPQVSAVKVGGERAYDLAREGAAFELAARDLWVERLELIETQGTDQATFEMECGKGGYVRAIARDLGQALGCLGHVASLRRLWSGPFDLEGAVTPEALEGDDLDALLLPLERGLEDLPQVRLLETSVAGVRNGNPAAAIATDVEFGAECWASFGGEAVALGRMMGGEFAPSRVFVRQE